MFKKNKNNVDGKLINTIIGPETSMVGEIYTKGIIRIDGYFKGEIVTERDLIIGENAFFKGEIKCLNASIAGKFEGNIEAEKKVELFKSGILLGNVKVESMMMEDGAFFAGNCTMNERNKKVKEEKKEFAFPMPSKFKEKEKENEIKTKENNTIELNRQAAKKRF